MTTPARTDAGPSIRRVRLLTLLAVVGPGLIAGMSDDDPPGITTYSILGAEYGYQLLWVLLFATVAVVLFHSLAARVGVITGQGLIGLIRQRFGARSAMLALLALLVANIGTTAAEFAGVAAGFELFGVSRYLSVPLAGVLISVLVIRGGFRGVERVLLAVSSVFLCYIAAGVIAHPDWTQAVQGLLVPTIPPTQEAFMIAAATIGTTLAPWGLSFIQSYAIDKRLTVADLPYLRVDVVSGSILAGVVGFFVVVACAATLNVSGVEITNAADAAMALEPLAGQLATTLFAIGLIGAALLAASILPLSTAYAVSDLIGRPADLDDPVAEAPLFFGTFGLVTVVGMALVLVPGVPLVPIMVLTQVVNAVLLLPLLVFLYLIGRDRGLMGTQRSPAAMGAGYLVVIGVIAACVVVLAVLALR